MGNVSSYRVNFKVKRSQKRSDSVPKFITQKTKRFKREQLRIRKESDQVQEKKVTRFQSEELGKLGVLKERIQSCDEALPKISVLE
jgi:hypothetical protein